MDTALQKLPCVRLRAWLCLWAVTGIFGTWGCAGSDEIDSPRADWLRSTLFDDHRDLWLRNPRLVEHKFEKMARDPYRFLRGTLPQYFRDAVEEGEGTTDFVSLESSQILLMGDPHPENFGAYRSQSGSLHMELNDFDAAQYGPFHFDIRRFATSLYVAHHYLFSMQVRPNQNSSSVVDRELFVESALRGYVDEIYRLRTSSQAMENGEARFESFWMNEFLARAAKRGDENYPLSKWTGMGAEGRVLEKRPFDDALSLLAEEDALIELSAREKADLLSDFERYPASLLSSALGGQIQVRDVARRYGAGVSSMPLQRFYLLLDGNQLAGGEDLVLELKESRDPYLIPGLPLSPRRAFRQNAERIVESQRRLQCEPELDPWLGFTPGDVAFRVRHVSGYQEGVDLSRIREAYGEGATTSADVQEFVIELAKILAASHARGHTMNGGSSLDAIFTSLKESPEDFIAENTQFALRYGNRILFDYEIFQELVHAYGFDLGFPTLFR